MCGLKQNHLLQHWKCAMSHPSWVCGLKHVKCYVEIAVLSHTLRGCVDWNSCPCTSSIWVLVTPFVGVWIETLIVIRLKSIFLVTPFVGVWIETLCTRVLLMPSTVTPFVGVWIETSVWWSPRPVLRHTLRGCVDWNARSLQRTQLTKVTPFVGVWIETWFQKAYWEHNLSHPSWVCGLKQE